MIKSGLSLPDIMDSAPEWVMLLQIRVGSIWKSFSSMLRGWPVFLRRQNALSTLIDVMFVMQVDAYEAKKQELVAENSDLRALLRSMQVRRNSLTLAFIGTMIACFVSDQEIRILDTQEASKLEIW